MLRAIPHHLYFLLCEEVALRSSLGPPSDTEPEPETMSDRERTGRALGWKMGAKDVESLVETIMLGFVSCGCRYRMAYYTLRR